MALPFVKFQRGSAAAYAALKRANRLESDALYFIFDAEDHEEGGLLYLGDILIGGVGVSGATQLSELTDVNCAGVLDGMLLQYQSSTQTWTPVTPSDILPIVSSGSTTGSETPAQALARIDSTPLEGDIIFINNKPYIYNGNNWQILYGTDLENRVTAVENGLSAVDGKIATAIANANHLSYQVVQTLPTVSNAANNVVYLVRNDQTTGDNLFDEYMLVNSNLEKIGGFTANLNNYVTTTTFNSTVQNLQNDIAGLEANLLNYVTLDQYGDEVGDISDLRTAVEDNDITIVEEVINIDRRLTWVELDQ